MIYAIYSTASLILACILASFFSKQKPNYLVIGLIAIVYLLGYSMIAHSDEFIPRYSCKVLEYTYDNSVENYQWFEDTVWGHLIDAEECMSEAKEISILLPCTNDKERASYCFKVLMAGFTPGSPQIKLMAMGLTFLTEYVPACASEWQRVVYLIEKAHYHTEMAIFYNNLSKQIFGESQF